MSSGQAIFRLPERLSAKANGALIGTDEEHLEAIGQSLESSIAELVQRLADERRAPGGSGQSAMDRDLEIYRISARLRTLRRFGLDLCLGRMVPDDGSPPVYVGRLGLTSVDGTRLLLDWRSPAAEPFFGATHANPMGLASRRRYRWTSGRITDYWDEVFTADGLATNAALDDQSAFIASLGSSRSPRMRDVLGTIQADQDAIIRAGSRGALVVDGGPGTGKTVVALHRAAYLLYSDPRLSRQNGGVLFVGPHQPYLAYVADVLPGLGEDGVQTCTLRDLVPGGALVEAENDPRVARLKSSTAVVRAVDRAVRYHEQPPVRGMRVETPWADLSLEPADWAEAIGVADDDQSHNDAREKVWRKALDILVDQRDEDVPEAMLRRWLAQSTDLRAAFARVWPVLDPEGVVADLYSVPAYLRASAPWLDETEIEALQRPDARAWTQQDLPILDAARRRIGDPETARITRRREAAIEEQAERMNRVVDDLIAADDDGEGLVTMLRVEDAQRSLIDDSVLPALSPDELAGPFAHIVVDEAQELTDAEWQMLLGRCPSRSFTIVGDRAQARHGFTATWEQRLADAGVDRVTVASLTVNYRTPEEVMRVAEPVIRSAIPDANVPTSIRSSGVPVRYGAVSELVVILAEWLAVSEDGVACVISTEQSPAESDARIRGLTPELAKGLEFDLVVLVEPDLFGDGIEGAVDRYVAMTRATHQLVLLGAAR